MHKASKMVSHGHGLLLVLGLLLVFQASNYATAAVQTGEVVVNGVSVVTEVGKELNREEVALNGCVEAGCLSEAASLEEAGSSNSNEEEGSQVRVLEEVMQLMSADYHPAPTPKRPPVNN